VLELFTTQACLFCPSADQFFNDLIEKTPVIALACHIDYFDVQKNSLSLPLCSKRQAKYAQNIAGSFTYTPQMILNGRMDVVGYKTDKVYAAFQTAIKNAPEELTIRPSDEEGFYVFDLPLQEKSEPSDIWIALTAKPQEIKIADGVNQNKKITYKKVVYALQNISQTIGTWNGEKRSIAIQPKRNKDPYSAIILVQNKEGISHAGEIILSSVRPPNLTPNQLPQ
jgi:hypothetical protein